MLHQAGDLPLHSLTIEQDKARGFFTNIAVTDGFRSSLFKLRREEHLAMPKVLEWLHSKNPWFAAYKNSVLTVKDTWEELTTHLDNIGLTAGIESATTRKGCAGSFTRHENPRRVFLTVAIKTLSPPSGHLGCTKKKRIGCSQVIVLPTSWVPNKLRCWCR